MLSVIGIEIETGQHLSITNCFDLQGRSPPSPGRATTDAAADNDGAVLRVAERRKKSVECGSPTLLVRPVSSSVSRGG